MDDDIKTLREQEELRELLKKMFAGGCSSCGSCQGCSGGDMQEIKEELQPEEVKKASTKKKKK